MITHPDGILLALVAAFESSVIPEFLRRTDAAEKETDANIVSTEALAEWLSPFIDEIAETRATTIDGLRAKARVGLFPATRIDEMDDRIVSSILRDLALDATEKRQAA